jgi:hypothetical protein
MQYQKKKFTHLKINCTQNLNLLLNLIDIQLLFIGGLISIGIKEKRKIKYKYNINKDFFKNWTKEMAWCLGFIAADGCILLGPRNGGTLSITVSEKDKEILQKINKHMSSNYLIKNIKTNFNTHACRLDITVREIVDDLISIGITPKKSKTLQWPNSIPDELIWHFIRGYYDGDGSIMYGKGYTNKKGLSNLQLRTSVLGTENFLLNIKKYFILQNPQYNPKIQDQSKNGFYRLEISGTESAIRLCNLIYKDSDQDIRLTRKYLKYKNFMEISNRTILD